MELKGAYKSGAFPKLSNISIISLITAFHAFPPPLLSAHQCIPRTNITSPVRPSLHHKYLNISLTSFCPTLSPFHQFSICAPKSAGTWAELNSTLAIWARAQSCNADGNPVSFTSTSLMGGFTSLTNMFSAVSHFRANSCHSIPYDSQCSPTNPSSERRFRNVFGTPVSPGDL